MVTVFGPTYIKRVDAAITQSRLHICHRLVKITIKLNVLISDLNMAERYIRQVKLNSHITFFPV